MHRSTLEILSRGKTCVHVSADGAKKRKKDEPISGRYRCDMQGRKKTGARLVPVIINREISVIGILFAFEDEVSRERGLIDFYVTSNAS